MQYEAGTTWRPPSAPEQPDFGTTALPDHPGQLMPSPRALWDAFEVALAQLERNRGREPRRAGYAAQSQEAVYEAGLHALTASLRAIYQEGQRDNPDAIAFPNEAIPEMQVVASSPGSGKSTSAKAFMLAVAREGLKGKYPLGCALVVQHVETAANAYRELEPLLHDHVAIWTSEHDADNQQAKREPRFTVGELEDYSIVIVTHEFFKNVRGNKARLYRRNGMTCPRVVTFVDEKVEQVKVYDVKFSDIVQVVEHIEGTDDSPAPLKDALRTLDSFAGRKRAEDRKLETPKDDPIGWSLARELVWFTTDEARQYARSRSAALQNTRASYERLEIVHIPSVAEGTLKRWLQRKENRREYVQHILDTVRSQVAPGQKALLVCKRDIVDARPLIEGWTQNVEPFVAAKDREFSWKFEGRLLSLTYWGGYGIGANHWTEADVVLLFDGHRLPRHATIAVTQGLNRALATDQPLSSMAATASLPRKYGWYGTDTYYAGPSRWR